MRSRYRRSPTGKLINLNSRALDIFDRLDRNPLLPTHYLHAFLGGNPINLSNRLGDLYHENNTPPYYGWFLDRPEGQWRALNARYVPATHANTRLAERALRDHGRAVRQKANPSNSFFHDLMASVLAAGFELSAKDAPEIAYIAWEEIRDHRRTPVKTRTSSTPFNIPLRGRDLRPDARPFGYRYIRPDGAKRSMLFAGIEADRGTEPLRPTFARHSSMAQKFAEYKEFFERKIYQSHFGFSGAPFVPIVTTSEARMQNMMALVTEIYGRKGSAYLLFRAFPEFASYETTLPIIDNLLTCTWQRVGHPPFRIVDALYTS